MMMTMMMMMIMMLIMMMITIIMGAKVEISFCSQLRVGIWLTETVHWASVHAGNPSLFCFPPTETSLFILKISIFQENISFL